MPELRAEVCRAVPTDKPKTSRYEADLEIEKRRKLGLPAQVLEQAGLAPGDRVHLQVRRDGRITITPVADLLDKYAGAIPGIVAATRLEEQPDR
jgi:antitoxin component of MazEF toxin-antitoxin module